MAAQAPNWRNANYTKWMFCIIEGRKYSTSLYLYAVLARHSNAWLYLYTLGMLHCYHYACWSYWYYINVMINKRFRWIPFYPKTRFEFLNTENLFCRQFLYSKTEFYQYGLQFIAFNFSALIILLIFQ